MRQAAAAVDGLASGGSPGQGADRITVGVVRDAWGIAGAFKVEPFNRPQDSVLRSARSWWLRRSAPSAITGAANASPPTDESARRLHIVRCRVHGDALVAQAEGISDRNAAEALKGAWIDIARADFPRAAAGEYYWVDLIGCTVLGQQGARLGEVIALDDHGAHAILIVRDGDTERLIPFVEHYLVSVDLVGRSIAVDWHPDW